MTNEEKAQEICEKNKRYKVKCSSLECYLSAMEMAEWKDEQHAEEKQQWIEKACEWLEEHVREYKYYDPDFSDGNIDVDDLVYTFKKAMEE
jgi:DNA-binding protein H-NS